jgi:hypothetical protein
MRPLAGLSRQIVILAANSDRSNGGWVRLDQILGKQMFYTSERRLNSESLLIAVQNHFNCCWVSPFIARNRVPVFPSCHMNPCRFSLTWQLAQKHLAG